MGGSRVFKAKKISGGKASGPALVTKGRLGLRGFVNPEEGTLTGSMGDLEGVMFAGSVAFFTSSKGSTTWCLALIFTCRHGNAPAAMVTSQIDPFVALGCVLQDIPLVQIQNTSIFDEIKTGDNVTVDADIRGNHSRRLKGFSRFCRYG